MMDSQKVEKYPFSSFRRKPEASHFNSFWTPAFAGVTELGLFTRPSKMFKLTFFLTDRRNNNRTKEVMEK